MPIKKRKNMISSEMTLKDERSNCYSVMAKMKVGDYLNFVKLAYKKKGGLISQRDVLRTTTALRIRKRMVSDLSKGALFPPIVLGILMSDGEFFQSLNDEKAKQLFEHIHDGNICIIDGMQRTTALIEASENDEYIKNKNVRIEFWIATNMNSMIYRMLILNSGQVPWTTRKQIETIFLGLITELQSKIKDVEILGNQNSGRRTRSGQYPAESIVELFLVFGARKEKIDTKERIADEFARLDMTDATSDSCFLNYFCRTLECMANVDRIFSLVQQENNSSSISEEALFKCGKDIFSSQTARVGFVVAVAQHLFGRIGGTTRENINELLAEVEDFLYQFTNRISKFNENELKEFLSLKTLNELLERRSGKVGDFQREFFLTAFRSLIAANFNVEGMYSCWRAY